MIVLAKIPVEWFRVGIDKWFVLLMVRVVVEFVNARVKIVHL